MNYFITVLILLLSGVITACGQQNSSQPLKPKQQKTASLSFQSNTSLVEIIQRAAKIRVTEHSFESDLFDMESARSMIPEKVVYKSIELNRTEVAALVDAIKNADRAMQETRFQDSGAVAPMRACAFAPHHSIDFMGDDKSLGTLRICFVCGKAEWEGAGTSVSSALVPEIHKFIKRIGMNPDQDWEALAKKQVER